MDLGMDSLMSVEIKMILERQYKLSMTDANLRKLTVKRLAELSASKGDKKGKEKKEGKSVELAEEGPVTTGPRDLLPRQELVQLNKGQEGKQPIIILHSLDSKF